MDVALITEFFMSCFLLSHILSLLPVIASDDTKSFLEVDVEELRESIGMGEILIQP